MAIFVNFASLEQKIPKISRLKTVFKQLQFLNEFYRKENETIFSP